MPRLLVIGGLLLAVGCQGNRQEVRRPRSPGATQSAGGQELLRNAVAQLAELPDAVDLDLQPARVIVDSTRSRDGQNVMAKLGNNPTRPADQPPVYNHLSVTAGNALFQNGEIRVEPDDIVKYFVQLDMSEMPIEDNIFGTENSRPSLAAGGVGQEGEDAEVEQLMATVAREKAVEFSVSQVISDNELLIRPALNGPIEWDAKVEIWRYTDDRIKGINHRLNLYEQRAPYPIGWEPSPDENALLQIYERLNQWLRQSQPSVQWSPHVLLDTLRESLRSHPRLQPFLSADVLSQESFDRYDPRILQEAVWFRDLSNWARGSSFDPVERAEALFDWTVRNIQLDPDDEAIPYRPWQILVHGHGTAAQRAWVFALLCRQQNLDVVMLALPAAEDGSSAGRFWLPALFSDGELYLFDTRLGVPIPTADRSGVATLSDVKADDSLLRALDLEDAQYTVSSADLDGLTAYVVASPFELSRRAELLEQHLSGADRMVLTLDDEFSVEQIASQAGVGEVKLWPLPTQTLLDQMDMDTDERAFARADFEPFATRPELWKARVLHFRGKKTLESAAQQDAYVDRVDDHREAGLLYMDPQVRPTDKNIATIVQPALKEVIEATKANAGYWIGLLSYEQGQYAAAEDWFRRLAAPSATARWQSGARYNLARSLESQGKLDDAIRVLESDQSPQRHGNRLRARWLRERRAQDDAADQAP